MGTKVETKPTVSTEPEVAEPVAPPAEKAAEGFSIMEHARIAKDTASRLAQQPKVRIRLRALSKDKPGDETVQVNGYTYLIMRGVDVEVPQTVADILMEAGLY